jgi:hypothetical protein
VGDVGGCEALFADGEQNLNGGFENGLDTGGGTGLDRRFTGLYGDVRGWAQMRTPNLKLSSSKHKMRFQSDQGRLR